MDGSLLKDEGRLSTRIGAKSSAILLPKMTNASVFPIRVVPMNRAGFCMKNDMILPDHKPCFPCSSICRRFAERNAISIPEKKKEKMSDVIIQGYNDSIRPWIFYGK